MPHACVIFILGAVVGYVLKSMVSDVEKVMKKDIDFC